MLPKIEIHNSLTRRKETLQPIEPGRLRVYVCGVTVYDFCHIGHARCYIVFDMIVRYLRARGYAVEYVRNITDIDDKIIRRAAENNESIDSLTSRFINEMYADFDALGIVRPDIEPRATEHMAGIIDMIAVLIERGLAYQADNGDVYYSVAGFPTYGSLSGKRIEDLRAGERVDVSEAKHDPLDFVLWKSAKPGEPSWDSPWGKGRPGWHIECSAMSKACLGEHFDIHGGGKDLIFPHHENEVAQSCGASGGEFVNLWIHNGFVNINEEKMSKSLDNFFTIREVRKHFHPEVIRYFLLSSHYRSPLNYSDDNLEKARINLERMYLALRGDVSDSGRNDYADRFHAVMQDDFNTPQAMAVLFEIVTAINTASESDKPALRANLKSLAAHLGLLQQDAETYLRGDSVDAARIEELIAERNQARKDRNFARADAIRDELLAEGILLEDGAEGTTWRRQ